MIPTEPLYYMELNPTEYVVLGLCISYSFPSLFTDKDYRKCVRKTLGALTFQQSAIQHR